MPKLLHPRKIVEKLHEYGLSYRRIAADTKTTGPTISRLANGQIKYPSKETEAELRKLYEKYIGE